MMGDDDDPTKSTAATTTNAAEANDRSIIGRGRPRPSPAPTFARPPNHYNATCHVNGGGMASVLLSCCAPDLGGMVMEGINRSGNGGGGRGGADGSADFPREESTAAAGGGPTYGAGVTRPGASSGGGTAPLACGARPGGGNFWTEKARRKKGLPGTSVIRKPFASTTLQVREDSQLGYTLSLLSSDSEMPSPGSSPRHAAEQNELSRHLAATTFLREPGAGGECDDYSADRTAPYGGSERREGLEPSTSSAASGGGRSVGHDGEDVDRGSSPFDPSVALELSQAKQHAFGKRRGSNRREIAREGLRSLPQTPTKSGSGSGTDFVLIAGGNAKRRDDAVANRAEIGSSPAPALSAFTQARLDRLFPHDEDEERAVEDERPSSPPPPPPVLSSASSTATPPLAAPASASVEILQDPPPLWNPEDCPVAELADTYRFRRFSIVASAPEMSLLVDATLDHVRDPFLEPCPRTLSDSASRGGGDGAGTDEAPGGGGVSSSTGGAGPAAPEGQRDAANLCPGRNSERRGGYAPSIEDVLDVWSEPSASTMKVRGPTYGKDGVKIGSDAAMFAVLGIDNLVVNKSANGGVGGEARDANSVSSKDHPEGRSHCCGKEGSFLRRWTKACHEIGFRRPPFLLVINFIVPWGNFQSYLVRPDADDGPFSSRHEDRPSEKAWRAFLEGDDEYRNKRLKFIPRVVAGPWMVKKLIGSCPVLIGTKIPVSYFGSAEENYLEICMDVTKGPVLANTIATSVGGKADTVTVDLGFLCAGSDDDETLPEQMLALFRLHHLDMKKA